MARKRIPPPPPPPGIYSLAKPLDKLLLMSGKHFTLFDRYDPPARYVLNPDCWAYSIDLTCCAAWNSHMGNREACTLITERHIAMSWHQQIPLGSSIAFVSKATADDEGNELVIFRTLMATQRMGRADLLIGYLNEPVPPQIRPALLLKPQKNPERFVGTPVLYTNQKKEVHIGELSSFGPGVQIKKSLQNKLRAPYFKAPTAYDSGNPIMLLYGESPFSLRPVLIAHFSTTGGGISYTYNHEALIETMAALGPERPDLIKQV
jgi:hypothetical protein